MKKTGYSRNYKIEGKTFRYDYDNAIVEWIYKDEDTGEWEVLDGVGLRYENWVNKDARDEYLTEWAYEIEADTECMMNDFIKYELPYLI